MSAVNDSLQVRANLVVAADRRLIPAVRSLVKEICLSEGMDEEGASQMELMTEEACLNVLDHALKGQSHATFRVSLERHPSRLVLAVEDQGMPPDWEKIARGEQAGIGLAIMQRYSQSVRFVNLGHEGKRLEIAREFLRPSFENASIEEEGGEGADKVEMASLDTPLTIRPMEPGDAPILARLMYQVYRYTYREFVYFPEKVVDLLASGLLLSTVAITPAGELAAHQGLMKEERDSPIAEICMGVVDPRFRGRKLFERMKEASFSHARGLGLKGLYGEAVTTHEYSQKANRAQGGRETGFVLGYTPANLEFRSICGSIPERTSVLLFYTRLNPEPERCVFAPEQHLPMISRIYEEGGFRRSFAPGLPDRQAAETERSHAKLKAFSDFGVASLQVLRYGDDFIPLVGGHLKELCTARVDCIYIDLPLADLLTPSICGDLEDMGFFLSGIMPETAHGDMLRLQYLNNTPLDPHHIVVASDFGRELLDYVVEGWKRAERAKFRCPIS
jgi:anti-sigma regulatory factor (Ser/Thr protein kinase)